MALDGKTKVREARLRRMASRRGMTLHRSRRRDTGALTYGRYWIVATGGVIGTVSMDYGEVGDPPGMTLDEVETYLNEFSRTDR